MKTDVNNSRLNKLVQLLAGKGNPEENASIREDLVERQKLLDEQFPGRVEKRQLTDAEPDTAVRSREASRAASKIYRSSIAPDSEHIKNQAGRSLE